MCQGAPWTGCPQPSGMKGPHSPGSTGTAAAWKPQLLLLRALPVPGSVSWGEGRGRILLPQHRAKGGSSLSPIPWSDAKWGGSGAGWKTGSRGPCPPTQHGKSGGKLRFQETAVPAAKKHESEQSPAIFRLETNCLRPRASCGGWDKVGAPPRPTAAGGVRAGVTPAGLCQRAGSCRQRWQWAAGGREFLWRGFRRFSIYFCTNLGTKSSPPPLPAFAGKESARGDSFQLDGARLFPRC